MTAPTINGTRYPQPVEELLPAARELMAELRELPSRNRLMRTYRIGAVKADELRDLLARDLAAEPMQVLREVVGRAEQGDVLSGEQIAAEYRLDPSVAALVSGLASVAVKRRAEGLTTDLDDDWTPPLRRVDDERQGDDPAADPWDYAQPIGPDLDRTGDVPGSAPAVDPGLDAVDVPLDDDAPAAPPPPQTTVQIAPDTRVRIDTDRAPEATEPTPAPKAEPQAVAVGHPGTKIADRPARQVVVWPIVLLALPAFVAIWGGWVGLGGLTGFGRVNLLPGIGSGWVIDTAITLPIGVETYAAYAMYVWLSGLGPVRARRFAKWSALGSLGVGALGQVAYHLLVAADKTSAPWWITMLVACLPVAVLGMGAALAHLVREGGQR